MKSSVEQNSLADIAVNEDGPDAPGLAAALERYAPFEFLSPANKALLARNELALFDQQSLQRQPRLSEFLLKQIALRSSLIMTLWFSLFDFLALSHHVLDPIDQAFVRQSDLKV